MINKLIKFSRKQKRNYEETHNMLRKEVKKK